MKHFFLTILLIPFFCFCQQETKTIFKTLHLEPNEYGFDDWTSLRVNKNDDDINGHTILLYEDGSIDYRYFSGSWCGFGMYKFKKGHWKLVEKEDLHLFLKGDFGTINGLYVQLQEGNYKFLKGKLKLK